MEELLRVFGVGFSERWLEALQSCVVVLVVASMLQETLLLEVLDARHVRKDAAYLAEKMGVQIARIGPENLASITTDGASSCLAAQNLLRNNPEFALAGRTGLLRCAEHMGNLIAGV